MVTLDVDIRKPDGSLLGQPDGLVVGSGTLSNLLIVNTNFGEIYQIDLNPSYPTPPMTKIATGGSRGDCLPHGQTALQYELPPDTHTPTALQQKHDTLVRVAGLNIRPHRPPTRSGEPVLFGSVEDETDLLHLGCFGEAIDRCTPVFLASHAIMVEGTIQRRGKGASLVVTRAKPFEARTFERAPVGIYHRGASAQRPVVA